MNVNEYHKASLYAQFQIMGTSYLAFRDIPQLIKKYANGNKTLDYGCGAGRSTRFLKSLDLDVAGVDTSVAMIEQAQTIDKVISYNVIESAIIPNRNNTYDLVFSSFVLFEISTKNELMNVFNEIFRVLKKGGTFIAITGSENMYSHPWLSLGVECEKNKNIVSGARVKIQLKEINLELYDYFWTDKDYKKIINKSGFSLLEKINPLGKDNDGYSWVSETKISPYVIYILKK